MVEVLEMHTCDHNSHLVFVVSGCKRTPKAELIKMDIVKKVQHYWKAFLLWNIYCIFVILQGVSS